MGPISTGKTDQVTRMDDVLRAHPGWSIRYDGMADRFIARREADDEEITGYELRRVLDEMESRG